MIEKLWTICLVMIGAPMLIYCCVKWGVVGYFRGKEFIERHRTVKLKKTFEELEQELKERKDL